MALRFAAFMALWTVFYYSVPSLHLLTWTVIGLGAVGAVLLGVRRYHPHTPLAWYLLAAAMLTLVSGDTSYNLLTDVFSQVEPFPSLADGIYLATYPLAAGGVMLMVRGRSPLRDRAALIDAVILTTAAALLLWVYIITPNVADRDQSWLANAVSIAYPLGDVMLLAVTARLATGGGLRGPAVRLLLLGVLGLTGSDVAYALVRLYGTWHVGSAADLGWVLFYVSWGAAALSPSMTELTEPVARSRRTDNSRVLPLAVAALVAPTVLMVEALEHGLRDGPVIAVTSALMFLLVLMRLYLAGRQNRELDNRAHTRAMLRELKYRAYRDSLTGLGNRLRFQDRAERALARAQDSGGVAAMLLIDLDNFKEVNDTQGHKVGDELLVAAAQRIAGAVRPGDLPVRLGGDEFAVLLSDGASEGAAVALAQRLIGVLAEPFRLSGAPVPVRASIGVATSPGGAGGTEEVLFRNADLALYAAKADGKGTWRLFDPSLYDAALQRLALRTGLDRALAVGEFELHYQPIVQLQGPPRVAGFEALVRWRHPKLGLLSPVNFVPVAEETGQISPIGAWILRRATADAAAAGFGYVAVNVSPHQFSGGRFVDTVRSALREAGLPPDRLTVEITENVFLHEATADALVDLQRLTRLGVRIAIDDFGTGYSSIGYLRDLKFDVIKADKSFVDHIADKPDHERLLRGIVHVARIMDIAVVAEGVETVAQRNLLREMGCAYAQGFLYSPAVPLGETAGVWATIEMGET
ncbi:EAL domain-containing protein [Catenulispora sp. NF23]|uniref:EAL domain-containing protein n=1 Tax=Catenulispora pinistramenti TaxID=2705254 RepID=A0ABS5L3C8_9ACTN|nr:EAL domain-containing protein [Catenulispora pinistramenti]MBS2536019.1 EAL domain-containing protein [Catenulispora pinistramenti]MBS2552737.1 EAL domain-containing protein [Catenulispora pinistramenti]